MYVSGEGETFDRGVIKKLKANCLWLLRIRAWEGLTESFESLKNADD